MQPWQRSGAVDPWRRRRWAESRHAARACPADPAAIPRRADPAPPQPRGSPRHGIKAIPSLTGIRGLAACWVLLFHLQSALVGEVRLPGLAELATVVRHGWAGVDLFFVLSGFILMHAHGQDFVGCRIGAPAVRFARLRVIRIYPLHLTVLTLIACLVAADPGFSAWYSAIGPGNLSGAAFTRTALLATRWFLPGSGNWNQPVWSLSVELLGYAVFPIIALALAPCRSFRIALGGALISLALLAAYQLVTRTVGMNAFDQRDAVTRMALCFLTGTALSRARRLAPAALERHADALALGALLLAGLSVVSWRYTLLMPLGSSALIFALSFETGRVNALVASNPLLFLGRISFPLYLFHVMPLMWLRYHFNPADSSSLTLAGIILAYVAVCLGSAAALHYAIERPFHRLGRRWAVQPVPASG